MVLLPAESSGRSGRQRTAGAVAADREGVHHQGVAREIHELPGVTAAVSSAEIERVVDAAVDALDVVAAPNSGWKSGSLG